MATPPAQIALVTASQMPRPDIESALLVEALAAIDVSAQIVPWDKETDWAAYPLVVIRSPWDYSHRLDDFIIWAMDIDRATRLVNPYSILLWNSHKSYLLELKDKGVPVIPTALLPMGAQNASLDKLHPALKIVLKPAVSAGARGVMKARADDPALAAHAAALLAEGDVLLQPFVPGVAVHGEVSLIFFDSVFSHAIRKTPALGDFRVQAHHGGAVHPHEPTAGELAAAHSALAAAPARTAYARVDLVEWEDNPAVMELELIEPELFLPRAPLAAGVFAKNLKSLLP